MSIFESVSGLGTAVAELPAATRTRNKGPISPFLPVLQELLDKGGAWCYQNLNAVPAEINGASVADELVKELRSAVRQVIGEKGKTVQMKTRRILSADKTTADIYLAVGYKEDKGEGNENGNADGATDDDATL
jgi:hypothetical protein